MTPCPEAMGWEFGYFEKQSVWDKMPNWEPAADRRLWALSDLWLSNPAKIRKKYCWVNIAVCPHLQLISYTQPNSTLSRIKCERYIFIKKCVRSYIEVRHYCWLCLRLYLYYVYICVYTTFPPGQYTTPQLHPCHRLFDQDGPQDCSSASL